MIISLCADENTLYFNVDPDVVFSCNEIDIHSININNINIDNNFE